MDRYLRLNHCVNVVCLSIDITSKEYTLTPGQFSDPWNTTNTTRDVYWQGSVGHKLLYESAIRQRSNSYGTAYRSNNSAGYIRAYFCTQILLYALTLTVELGE